MQKSALKSFLCMARCALALPVAAFAALAFTLASMPARGATPPPAAASGLASADAASNAVSWLSRMREAARTESYAGTFVYQRGGTVQSAHIVHIADGRGNEFEEIESLDGAPRRVLRRNDDIFTFLPASKTVIVDKLRHNDLFPALMNASASPDILSVYQPSVLASDRVAGRPCDVIEFTPKDGYRFAYRFWIDRESGLLLRAQTLSAAHRVLEQMAFSELKAGLRGDAQRADIVARIADTSGWKTVRSPVSQVDLEAEGWQFNPVPAGFAKVRELRRPMAARDPRAPPVPVDQAVFSDGFSTVSIFIEPVNNSERSAGEGENGATHVLVERQGDDWITLLGEVPALTLRDFAAAIKYKPSR